jgi:peroxiredoxin Q/BCP
MKFARDQQFPFPLLSDTDKSIAIAYGAAADASAKYPRRVTFLIGADGRIERAAEVSDIPGHIEDMLRAVQSPPPK